MSDSPYQSGSNQNISTQEKPDRLVEAVGIPAIIVIVCITVAFTMFALKGEPEKEETPASDLIVKVIEAQKQDINFIIASQGMVRPRTETTLASEVNGRIANISDAFVAGAFVKAGDVLIQIEAFDYETELKAAEANLARAKASLEEEIARGIQAKREWKNLNRSGVPPALVLRKPQLANEKANVLSAEAALARAERNLARTTIRAPYDGLIRERKADLGQFITVGSTLGIISDISVAEIRLPILDKELAYITIPPNQSGQINRAEMPNVILSADAQGKNQHWQGFISRSEGVIDESTRVVYLVAQIDDPYNMINENTHDSELKFGTYINAKIEGDTAKNIIMVPRYSMRSNEDLIVIDKDSQLQVRKVNVIRADSENVYVSEGVENGERISLTPIENPINGTNVQIEVASPETSTPSQTDAIAYKKEGVTDGGN